MLSVVVADGSSEAPRLSSAPATGVPSKNAASAVTSTDSPLSTACRLVSRASVHAGLRIGPTSNQRSATSAPPVARTRRYPP